MQNGSVQGRADCSGADRPGTAAWPLSTGAARPGPNTHLQVHTNRGLFAERRRTFEAGFPHRRIEQTFSPRLTPNSLKIALFNTYSEGTHDGC